MRLAFEPRAAMCPREHADDVRRAGRHACLQIEQRIADTATRRGSVMPVAAMQANTRSGAGRPRATSSPHTTASTTPSFQRRARSSSSVVSRSKPVLSATRIPAARNVSNTDRAPGTSRTPAANTRSSSVRNRAYTTSVRCAWCAPLGSSAAMASRLEAPRRTSMAAGVTATPCAASAAVNAAGTCPSSSTVVPAMSETTRSTVRRIRISGRRRSAR